VRSEDDGGVCQRGPEGGKSNGLRTSCSLQDLQQIPCRNDVEHEDIAIRYDSAKMVKGARRKIAESRLYIRTWA